ncbi:hypothetical protein PUN28_019438 [Cardiocondyla obscurior]|uniref:Reverse transcriptase domain-containing protein n=1 Tax=Cardiocondyla obscurior TaxID=286306 RepID=A0AAW2EGX1_9HYME
MIYNCLSWWLEYYKKFANSQFGFRKNRSCIDNLSILYAIIIRSFKASSRRVHCRFEDVDKICWAFRELPQNSVFSPILYACYTKTCK